MTGTSHGCEKPEQDEHVQVFAQAREKPAGHHLTYRSQHGALPPEPNQIELTINRK